MKCYNEYYFYIVLIYYTFNNTILITVCEMHILHWLQEFCYVHYFCYMLYFSKF